MVSHIVLVVHGIRDFGEWQQMVREEIEEPGTIVIPIKFGYFNVLRFLIPFATRQAPLRRIEREMLSVTNDHGSAKLSVISHSFGTDIVTSVLKDHPKSLRIWRMILCGSVVRQEFRWDSIAHQIGEPDMPTRNFIVNDCGSGDQWPLLAQALTWGFGAAGTDGFGSTLVQDRFHDGGHSLFMTREFVRQYWKPFLSEGRYVPTKSVAPRSRIPQWLQHLGMLPLRWILAALILAGSASLLFLGWRATRLPIGIVQVPGTSASLGCNMSTCHQFFQI